MDVKSCYVIHTILMLGVNNGERALFGQLQSMHTEETAETKKSSHQQT